MNLYLPYYLYRNLRRLTTSKNSLPNFRISPSKIKLPNFFVSWNDLTIFEMIIFFKNVCCMLIFSFNIASAVDAYEKKNTNWIQTIHNKERYETFWLKSGTNNKVWCKTFFPKRIQACHSLQTIALSF